MIAIVSRPAERKLGQIPRADDEPARLVRRIHQDERARARLRVFVGDVVKFGIMPDVLKMLKDGIDDADRSRGCPHRLDEL